MLKLLTILLLCSTIISCTKTYEEHQPISVSYIIDEYTTEWKHLRSFTSYHVCAVYGEELKKFQAMSREPQRICDEYRTIRLLITTDKEYHHVYR